MFCARSCCCSSTSKFSNPVPVSVAKVAVNAEVVRSAAEQLNIIPFCLQKKKRCRAEEVEEFSSKQVRFGVCLEEEKKCDLV